MKNIGETSRKWLEDAGINSVEDLRAMGSVEAYEAVKETRDDVSLNLLWALEGAIQDVHWLEITDKTKDKRKAELS
jgi:DNA transformation protein